MSARTFILAVTGCAFIVAACGSCGSYGTSVVEVGKTRMPVASVSLTVPASLVAGQTARAIATPKDANGTVLTDRSVQWFISSASIASVSDSGIISGISAGDAVVSAVSEGIAGRATLAVITQPTPIATVSVAVRPSALLVGQTAIATATVEDSTGTPIAGQTITWESSDITVATVDTGGTVKAKGSGTARIKGSSSGKSNSSVLFVSAPTAIPVASVSVSPATATLQLGATVQLSAVTYDSANNVLTGRLISWSSSNSGIATVSSSGLVTAVAAGSATVTASSEGQMASAAITVSAPAVASVSVSPATSSLLVGGTVQLSATTRDANNNVLTGRVVTWSSSNIGISTVSASGLVTAVAAGTATITATSETKTGTSAITVSAPAVASVTVSPATASVQVGTAVQFSAVTRDANNNILTGRSIIWSSSNVAVATVSLSGLGTAVAAGTAQITATSEGKSGSAALTVSSPAPVPVASVSVSLAASTLNPGQTTQATATTYDANKNVLTGRVISWSSSNIAIATVSSSGLVTAVAAGTAQITATSEGITGSATLTVASSTPPPSGSAEPSGMTPISERPFSAMIEDSWYFDSGNQTNFSIVTDATAPKSPSNIGQMLFPAGMIGGIAPNSLERDFPTPPTTLYVSYWMKVSSNWYGHLTSISKVVHFWIGGSNHVFNSVYGLGTGPLSAWVHCQGIVAGGNQDAGASADFSPNLGQPATIVRGQWQHYELVFKANTSGTADGTLDWWLDGIHVGSYGGIQFISGAGTWQLLKWNPTWGGAGGTVPADQYMSMDHIYISGKP